MGSLLLLLPLLLAPADTLSPFQMQKLLPANVLEWRFSDSSKAYSGREIFQYMDGAGEVYLAYNFHRLLVQRYTRPDQEEILVEVFDMGSSRNAFGTFTNLKGYGESVEIGQGGEYKSGLLSFWKGRFFVSVLIDRENAEAKKGVFQIAALISEAIKEQGATPDILNLLPKGSYFPATLRYFYRNEILNIHYFVAERNLLHLSEQTDAVLVRMKANKSYLLLIRYNEMDEAPTAWREFVRRTMPKSGGAGVMQNENKKWTVCRWKQNLVGIVFDAPREADAQNLLDAIIGRRP